MLVQSYEFFLNYTAIPPLKVQKGEQGRFFFCAFV